MSPNYPNEDTVGGQYDANLYSCNSGLAFYKVTLTADIPENCSFIFYSDDQIPVELSNVSVTNQTLLFNATKNLTTIFDGRNCSKSTFRGYLLNIYAEYIVLSKDKTVDPDWPLIIGSSGGGLILICITVITVAIYCIRSRQKRYDQIYKILKEMNMSPEEIAEMKSKSDEMMIQHGKIHINFDKVFGKGVSSTVFKGHLIGPSPLHEQQKTAQTQQFVDCDVAVKVTNKFGQTEVEQLFKEIDAMKKMGYHENVMCMLGWALPGDTPCLVFEIAEKDLLHYVSEFRDAVAEVMPYQKFLDILRQIILDKFLFMFFIRLRNFRNAIHCLKRSCSSRFGSQKCAAICQLHCQDLRFWPLLFDR